MTTARGLDDNAMDAAFFAKRDLTRGDKEKPALSILYGSRARGGYDEARSDIDLMLVQDAEPSP